MTAPATESDKGSSTSQHADPRVSRFLIRYGGDAKRGVKALLAENARLKQQLKDQKDSPYRADEALKSENERLERENEELAAKLPSADAVILTGDDAKSWPAFKALGISADKAKEALKERDTLKAELAERDKEKLIATAAEKVGYNPKVLADQVALRKLHVEMRDVTEKVDGKDVVTKVPHVRPANDDKATLEPLTAYAERELAEYMPLLKAQPGTNGTGAGQQPTGPAYPEQRGTGGGQVKGFDPDKAFEEMSRDFRI